MQVYESEVHARANAIDFSQDGRLLITSSDDDSIKIYDAVEAGEPRTLFSKKYGASLIRFTHAGTTVLHGSTKVGIQQ